MHTTVAQERMNGSNNIYKSKRGGASGYFEKCSSELTSICLAWGWESASHWSVKSSFFSLPPYLFPRLYIGCIYIIHWTHDCSLLSTCCYSSPKLPAHVRQQSHRAECWEAVLLLWLSFYFLLLLLHTHVEARHMTKAQIPPGKIVHWIIALCGKFPRTRWESVCLPCCCCRPIDFQVVLIFSVH